MPDEFDPELKLKFSGKIRQHKDGLIFNLKFMEISHVIRLEPEKLAEEEKVIRFRSKPKPLPFEVIKQACEESGVLIPGSEDWIYSVYLERWSMSGHPDDLAREIRRKPPPLFPLEKARLGISNDKTVIGWGFIKILNEEGIKDPVVASKKIAWSIWK